MYKRYCEKILTRWIPVRVVICIMMFTACWTSYMCRLQMAILAVPMIETGASEASVSGVCSSPADASTKDRRSLIDNRHDDESSINHREREETMRNDSESFGDIVFPNGTDEWRDAARDKRLTVKSSVSLKLFTGLPFKWSAFVRGQLISAYGWGNVPGNLLGGVFAQKYGPRRAILWSSIIAALISLLTPLIAHLGWIALAVSRIVIGLTGGVTFPACHTLVARWAPPDEKGRFVWTLQGGTFGSIFLFGMISSIAENINWEAGWYIPALLMFVWILFWAILAFDSPEEHPAITDTEREYIMTAQEGSVRKGKPSLKETPIKKILTSVPFVCLVLCHFGNLFLLFFYQTGMMLYQTKALGFKLTKGGVVSGLPWASRVIMAFFFGWAGDAIKRRNLVSITFLRKGATFFSHLLPGVCLIIVGYLGCSFLWANVFLILALGFNGAASISNLSNNQDLSPNYAGFLYGIMNTIGSLSGIIVPPLIEEIAGKWGNPIDKWQILFWIGAAFCIVCMLIFIIGGSGEVQAWNELGRENDDTEIGAVPTNSSAPRGAEKT